MVFVILLMIAGVSARRIPDDVNEHGGVHRSDTGYSQGEPHVIHKQAYNVDKIDQHALDIATNEAANDSINKINDENDHRLRTNAYTAEVETTERVSQGDKIYTNVKRIEGERNHGQDKINLEHRISSRPVPNRHTPNHNKSIQNKQKPRTHGNQKPDERVLETDRNAKTNENVQTNGEHLPGGNPRGTVQGKPISTNNTRDPRPRTNGTEVRADDEPIWVWETEEKATSADPGSLDDRSAFSGDQCPTGKTDGRNQAPKIHSTHPSPEHTAGAEGSMTVAHGDSSPERLGGALRRLHYRATRRAHSSAARHHSTPKVSYQNWPVTNSPRIR
ncbi:hypothetical protein KGM_203532 [Danaus plexippus plexippus]|uniref:Uncharacterized protein n=1 Tax=Danaus plexippus plexippus TaxID=278856 RepID=A0A212FE96_DANPL|nr:hypothetical protein KGM_203532 [Danaus plexippus plexippus]